MPVQVPYIDYGNYRYKVGDTIKISSNKEYMYISVTSTSYNSCPNISQSTRKITQIWASDGNQTVYNPIGTEYVSGDSSSNYGRCF